MQILNTDKLVEIFYFCDEFDKVFQPYCQQKFIGKTHQGKMNKAEMMSIVIYYHISGFKCFKYYYNFVIRRYWVAYFPDSYEYSRFIQRMPSIQLELFAFLLFCRMAPATEANYIDSKALKVCHNKRIPSHKVFKDVAQRGKTSTGWFYGFKLHLVINQYGQIVHFRLTAGNVADNNHKLLTKMFSNLSGFFYGDKGYLTILKEQLEQQGTYLITKVKRGMQPAYKTALQHHYLQHRALIETVFDLLTYICNVEHSRHRSAKNFLCNLYAALIAYTFFDRCPQVAPYQPKPELYAA